MKRATIYGVKHKDDGSHLVVFFGEPVGVAKCEKCGALVPLKPAK